MKCAKCGREVASNAPECPWCTAGNTAETPVKCPNCGSTQIDAVRRNYNTCCGCLGWLLFNWLGLLLGFLGAGNVELVCRRCGTHWRPGTR